MDSSKMNKSVSSTYRSPITVAIDRDIGVVIVAIWPRLRWIETSKADRTDQQ